MSIFQHRNATEQLFKSYSRGMYNICLRMVGNKQDAEDVLQDAFYNAYINIKKLKSPDKFGAWLKAIVINSCLKFLRSRVVFPEFDLDKMDIKDGGEDNPLPYSMKQINNAIVQLPDGCRVVFNLYLLEGYTHKQIAEQLEISESTSKSQYQRARKLLKNMLLKTQGDGQV